MTKFFLTVFPIISLIISTSAFSNECIQLGPNFVTEESVERVLLQAADSFHEQNETANPITSITDFSAQPVNQNFLQKWVLNLQLDNLQLTLNHSESSSETINCTLSYVKNEKTYSFICAKTLTDMISTSRLSVSHHINLSDLEACQ